MHIYHLKFRIYKTHQQCMKYEWRSHENSIHQANCMHHAKMVSTLKKKKKELTQIKLKQPTTLHRYKNNSRLHIIRFNSTVASTKIKTKGAHGSSGLPSIICLNLGEKSIHIHPLGQQMRIDQPVQVGGRVRAYLFFNNILPNMSMHHFQLFEY